MEKTIKTINFDGSITEVEVSFDVWKADKEFNSKENYQNYKKRKHSDNRKFEISLEEILERQNNQKPDEVLICESAENAHFHELSNEMPQKVLGKLSEKQRRRVILKFFENLTFEEIAKIENISFYSAKESIEAAVKKLNKILEKFKF
ncbi:MAG: sigma-70 family RNA polymerase sigma factor [Oscillospiraceae bacterium]|nr:sigma-70 family RNA polymerase sigma factor [Oscillospiraceae bacterium]